MTDLSHSAPRVATDTCIFNVLSEAQRKIAMFDEGAQQRLIVADCEGGKLGLVEQLVELAGCEIRQGIGLGVTPDQLHGIEFGGVRWQQVSAHAVAVAHQPSGDGFADMSAQSIPNQSDRYAQRTAQLPHKCEDRFAVEIGIGQQPEVGTHAAAPRRDHQGTDHRNLAPRTAALHQHGGMAAGRPSAPHQRRHQEPSFVDEDDRRAPAGGVFFTCGQRLCTQRRIAGSSRSKARRAGFCELQSKSCSSRPI